MRMALLWPQGFGVSWTGTHRTFLFTMYKRFSDYFPPLLESGSAIPKGSVAFDPNESIPYLLFLYIMPIHCFLPSP